VLQIQTISTADSQNQSVHSHSDYIYYFQPLSAHTARVAVVKFLEHLHRALSVRVLSFRKLQRVKGQRALVRVEGRWRSKVVSFEGVLSHKVLENVVKTVHTLLPPDWFNRLSINWLFVAHHRALGVPINWLQSRRCAGDRWNGHRGFRRRRQ